MSSAKYLPAKMGSVIIDDQTQKHRLLHVLAHMDMNKKDFMLVLLDLLLKKQKQKKTHSSPAEGNMCRWAFVINSFYVKQISVLFVQNQYVLLWLCIG